LSLLLSFLSCRAESPQRSTQLFSKKGDDDDDDDDVTGKEDDMEELAGDKKPAAKEHDTDELSNKTLVVSGSDSLGNNVVGNLPSAASRTNAKRKTPPLSTISSHHWDAALMTPAAKKSKSNEHGTVGTSLSSAVAHPATAARSKPPLSSRKNRNPPSSLKTATPARKKASSTPTPKKPSARKNPSSARKKLPVNPFADDPSWWQSIVFVGETTGNAGLIHAGAILANGGKAQYTFAPNMLDEVLDAHPNCKVFVFAFSQPCTLPNIGGVMPNSLQSIPVLNAILVPEDLPSPSPPPLVHTPMDGVVHMSKLGFFWSAVPGWKDGRLFFLKSKRRATKNSVDSDEDMATFQHAHLFTVRSEDSTVRKINFEFVCPDGEEAFSLDIDVTRDIDDVVAEFCEENELDQGLYSPVKKALQSKIAEANAKVESKIELLNDYGFNRESLDAIKVYKIYPENEFIVDSLKKSLVNKFYGKSINSFAKASPRPAGTDLWGNPM
jgi:hypothetical protein